MTLADLSTQWYMGSNIPGKPKEPYIYIGGVPSYYKTLSDRADNGFAGFKFKE